MFEGRIYLAGPAGLYVYAADGTLERLYRTGIDLPPAPLGNRIAQARQWGWSAIPGSDFTATEESAGWRLEGHSVGHGVGMCQLGATGMAAVGVGFRQILAHYYPNTELISLP